MAVLKYYDTTLGDWEPLAVLSGTGVDIIDLQIASDNLHLINAEGTKVGSGVKTSDIAGAATISTKIVDTLPTEGISASTIYMVPDSTSEDSKNGYNEYIYVNDTWERVDATAEDTNTKEISNGTIDDLF